MQKVVCDGLAGCGAYWAIAQSEWFLANRLEDCIKGAIGEMVTHRVYLYESFSEFFSSGYNLAFETT